MILTSVSLNQRGQSLLRRHRRTMHVVIAQACRTQDRILWCAPDPGRILIQSPNEIDATVLSKWGRVDGSTTYDPQPTEGQLWHLQTVANPVRRHGSKASALTPAEWGDWITRQLDGAAVIHDMQAEQVPTAYVHKPTGQVTIKPVAFSAKCRVTDPEIFRRTVAAGIGRGKAYGFGMILTRQAA